MRRRAGRRLAADFGLIGGLLAQSESRQHLCQHLNSELAHCYGLSGASRARKASIFSIVSFAGGVDGQPGTQAKVRGSVPLSLLLHKGCGSGGYSA